MSAVATLEEEIRACRACLESDPPLPHEPRPVLQISETARVLICGQAPGVRVHQSGIPFTDPSGDRLRAWLGVDETVFYDRDKIGVAPMGFCFPGLDAKGGDLPPRKECAPLWRTRLMALLPNVELLVLVGFYAQKWHLGARAKRNLTETVAAWRDYWPAALPTPHPSWRNNAWLKKNAWFDVEVIPALRTRMAELL